MSRNKQCSPQVISRRSLRKQRISLAMKILNEYKVTLEEDAAIAAHANLTDPLTQSERSYLMSVTTDAIIPLDRHDIPRGNGTIATPVKYQFYRNVTP